MKKLALIIFLLMVLSACSNSYDEPSTGNTSSEIDTATQSQSSENLEDKPSSVQKTYTAPEDLDYNDFLEDYDYFWDTLDENYPFYNVANRLGYNIDELRNNYREKVTESTTLEEFAQLMRDMVDQFGYTGHIEFFGTGNMYKGYYDLYTFDDMGHMAYLADKLREEQTVATYNYLFPEIAKEIDYQDDSNASDKPKGDNVSTEILEEGKVAYVKIDSFSGEYVDEDSEILYPFFKSVQDYPHIIIDIRGNGGGSDWYWNNNLVYPLLSKPLSVEMPLLFNNTPLIREYIDTDNLFELSVPLEDMGDLPNLDTKDRSILTHACILRSEVLQEDIQSKFSGKLWLLVDDYVYSSSESFTMMCKATGYATIVGENTGGDGGGIDPMIFSLPNSGLLWKNSIFYSINPDGSSNEEVGTTPDVKIKENEDALEVCLKEISNYN